MTAWAGWLRHRLGEMKPERLCTLDEGADRFLADSLPSIPRQRLDSATAPCTLALGVNALDHLDAALAGHLIHRVRLFAAPRLLLVAQADCALDDAAFRALGFIREMADSGTGVRIQSYDLATYKPTPDWLNARYWAHPGRWEP
ncbi:MAG: DUF6231 family protein [Thiobacillus sp.]